MKCWKCGNDMVVILRVELLWECPKCEAITSMSILSKIKYKLKTVIEK